jgi:hypothetical protein
LGHYCRVGHILLFNPDGTEHPLRQCLDPRRFMHLHRSGGAHKRQRIDGKMRIEAEIDAVAFCESPDVLEHVSAFGDNLHRRAVAHRFENASEKDRMPLDLGTVPRRYPRQLRESQVSRRLPKSK